MKNLTTIVTVSLLLAVAGCSVPEQPAMPTAEAPFGGSLTAGWAHPAVVITFIGDDSSCGEAAAFKAVVAVHEYRNNMSLEPVPARSAVVDEATAAGFYSGVNAAVEKWVDEQSADRLLVVTSPSPGESVLRRLEDVAGAHGLPVVRVGDGPRTYTTSNTLVEWQSTCPPKPEPEPAPAAKEVPLAPMAAYLLGIKPVGPQETEDAATAEAVAAASAAAK